MKHAHTHKDKSKLYKILEEYFENNKAKVLEFNVRFGDPETQSILLRLDSDLFEIMDAVSKKELKNVDIKWKNEHVACLVLASAGYPGNYEKNKT